MSNQIEQLSVKSLLKSDVPYQIPMYQRNYSWEEGEITQLIQDVIDYSESQQCYYIGTLVIFEKKNPNNGSTVYETIDGQQRLTTLSLLASFLKNEKNIDVNWYNRLILNFECRKNSQKTFEAIFGNHITALSPDDINSAILNGYQIIQKVLPQKLAEYNISESCFSSYLFEKVQIMRVAVPRDTELNHYFEIMNNRGEQLEKHEVLKSRLLEVLNKISEESERIQCRECFHRIWEACSNMEKYVQSGFSKEQRHSVFGYQDWGRFELKSFDDVLEVVAKSAKEETESEVAVALADILSCSIQERGGAQDDEDDVPERFNTVINFPNFLLHVLRVCKGKDIPLDDKRLISIFDYELLRANDPNEVKEFGFTLLKCKYLYDQYIIKREFIGERDGWSLKRYKWTEGGLKRRSERGYYVNTFGDENGQDGINRRILMLLSAFHVSTPTLVYKHWLNAALCWLYRQDVVSPEPYIEYMESVAKAFVFDRFLRGYSESEYYQIIYERGGECKSHSTTIPSDKLRECLSFGKIENNLVFNFLDYLLWVKHKDEITHSKIKVYEFTFRSSVEHYYPQHPLDGYDALPSEPLNSFGNLCLISHSKNSRLSNFMPNHKKEYYEKNPIDSIKQYLMMKYDEWTTDSIENHESEMIDALLGCLEKGEEGTLR